jgi:hypothetical protein
VGPLKRPSVVGVTSIVRRAGIDIARAVIRFVLAEAEWLLARLSLTRERQLRRRRRERLRGRTQWFLDDELALVDAVAAVIIPSDENGPGAREAGVTATLDARVAASPPLQSLHERGLFALDALARRTYAASFVDLTQDQQLTLLNRLDQLAFAVSAAAPLTRRVRNVALLLRAAANGSLPAAELFMRLVADVKQSFYTSPIAWRWLGYDGPPMPQGYPDLAVRSSRPLAGG